ncbi:MAG: aminomethyl-transferring glycine dehydrogenase subunit GcvPA [Firmicutes bacterium]|jgi:glycine dehydrogenase subunit 1|nr:aminomethyl-transferring glycine dehydrogenase subunit GcvPA [Bacillota bacterium]
MGFTPVTDQDRQAMLDVLGLESVEDLFQDVPPGARFQGKLDLPEPMTEGEIWPHLLELSSRNANLDEYVCFRGAGAYDHLVPRAIGHILSRSEFLTAYTPYQAEISQGVLQAIYEYQSMICLLTGMDVANASMYDGPTALAEAAIMTCGATRRAKVLAPTTIHPVYRQVAATYLRSRDLELVEIPAPDGVMALDVLKDHLNEEVAGVLVQHPNFFGCLEPVEGLAELVHGVGALLVACVDPISLGVLKAPADYGADIVVGEGQALGNQISFGGPYLGFFAAREKLVRRMPGRIAGATVDSRGRRGFVLTLQAREQHIRRERATSNICSNQALNALAATVYLALVGPAGLKEIASQCAWKARYAWERITALEGFAPMFQGPFFKEFAVSCRGDVDEIDDHLLQKKIIGGLPLKKLYPQLGSGMLFCVTEARTKEQIDALVSALGEV